MFEETFVLNNGVKIPKLALDTWLMDDRTAERCATPRSYKWRRNTAYRSPASASMHMRVERCVPQEENAADARFIRKQARFLCKKGL